MDRGFKYHKAVAQIWGVLGLLLAEADILPLDPVNYVTLIQEGFNEYQDAYGQTLESNNISLGKCLVGFEDSLFLNVQDSMSDISSC